MVFVYIADLRDNIPILATNFPLSTMKYLYKQILELVSLNTNDHTSKRFVIEKSPFDETEEVNLRDPDCFLIGRIFPTSEIYNKAAYRIRKYFPPAYPFKPPGVCFLTRIYHPNVDEHGM